MVKIYVDDPNLPYKTTRLSALYTKSEIDGILAKYGIHKAGWNWNPNANDVWVIFHIEEEINGVEMDVPVKIEAFAIWEHKKGKAETINWNISMRVMYWFIKTLLESAYLKQSSKTVAFLPYIINESTNENMAQVIIPRLATLSETLALEDKKN